MADPRAAAEIRVNFVDECTTLSSFYCPLSYDMLQRSYRTSVCVEMSHRSSDFIHIMDAAEATLRQLL